MRILENVNHYDGYDRCLYYLARGLRSDTELFYIIVRNQCYLKVISKIRDQSLSQRYLSIQHLSAPSLVGANCH